MVFFLWNPSDVALKVGQLALAVGRTSNTGPIASFGIISGVSGEWKTWRGGTIDPFVRLDISAYPTLSGGAAVDAGGNLIGLVSTGLSRSSVFAVTGATINRIEEKLIEHGYISQGFLRVALQPVSLPKEMKEKLQQDSGIMLFPSCALVSGSRATEPRPGGIRGIAVGPRRRRPLGSRCNSPRTG